VTSRNVTRLRWLLLAFVLVSPARADEPRPLQCVQFWPEARYSGAGYDHWVHLLSDCDALAICSVVTNVNPDVIEARVAPGEHVAVLTWRGSPAREFKASAYCRSE